MATALRIYTVSDSKTGEILAAGTAKQCAILLGITEGSFWTYRTRSANGKGMYHIESIGDLREKDVLARDWDDAFGWLRKKLQQTQREAPYPCNRCTRHSLCEFMDDYCEKWELWYKTEHDRVAELLHNEAKRIVR